MVIFNKTSPMKKLFSGISALIVFVACNKTPNSTPPPANAGGQVVSVNISQPAQDFIGKDSFRYDANNNLISCTRLSINIASAPSPEYDSGTLYFTIDPSTNLPSEYIDDFRKYFYPEDYVYRHKLFYDQLNRVIKDSVLDILNGPPDFKTVSYYTYSSNTVKIETAYNGTSDISLLDSFILEGGSISGRSEYGVSGADTSLSYRWTVNVNVGTPNPFYSQKTSGTLGAFYLFVGAGDYLSHDISLYVTEKFAWTTNSAGKVISGLGDAGTTIQFKYQQ
jgi:hypothetical protein